MRTVQRKEGSTLYRLQRLEAEREIRAAFMAVPAALCSRPASHRWLFDNAARRDCPTSPWLKLQEAVRSAACAAQQDGRPVVVEETRKRIKALYETLAADALAGLPPEHAELDVVSAALAETVAEGAANVTQAEFLARPTCRERLRKAVADGRAQLHALGRFVYAGERRLFAGHAEPRVWQ